MFLVVGARRRLHGQQARIGAEGLLAGAGKRQEALEHLTTATTMNREMDIRFWLEQAEAELRELA